MGVVTSGWVWSLVGGGVVTTCVVTRGLLWVWSLGGCYGCGHCVAHVADEGGTEGGVGE